MISSIQALQQQQHSKQPYPGQPFSGAPEQTESDAAQTGGAGIVDRVTISETAKELNSDKKKSSKTDGENLSEEERQQAEKLKKRDAEVKAHERAHMAAGGGLVQGGASYTYQRGADGQLYAVGGEVKIDTSAERDPDQTIRKMEQVKRAALAPAEPSGTDRAVAAQASQIQLQAQMEKVQQNKAESEDEDSDAAQAVPGPESNEDFAQTADVQNSDENVPQPSLGEKLDEASVQGVPGPESVQNAFQTISNRVSTEDSAPSIPNREVDSPPAISKFNLIFSNDSNYLGNNINLTA